MFRMKAMLRHKRIKVLAILLWFSAVYFIYYKSYLSWFLNHQAVKTVLGKFATIFG